jgi:N-acetylneuraminate synthase
MKPIEELNVDGHRIGSEHPTFFIADIAANHDGDLGRAKELIYKAREAGANAAKFQHFRAETIVSSVGFSALGSQQAHQSTWKKSVVDLYREASLCLAWTESR